MKPKEKFNQEVWWILQEIKKEQFYLPEKEQDKISFSLRETPTTTSEIPSFEVQRQLLRTLSGWGVFDFRQSIADQKRKDHEVKPKSDIESIVYGPDLPEFNDPPLTYILSVHQKEFDKTYGKYEKLFERNNKKQTVSLVDVTKITTEEPIEVIIFDLESKYKAIEFEKKEKEFFLKIADYGKYLIDHKSLHQILNQLHEASKKDEERYRHASDLFWKKWQTLTKDILEQAEKAGITDNSSNPALNPIDILNDRMKEKPNYDENYLHNYYLPYKDLIEKFEKADKKALIAQTHLVKKAGETHPLLEDYYDKAKVEWEKFKLLRDPHPWWADYQIMRLTHGILKLEEKNPYYTNDNIIDQIYQSEFDSIVSNRTRFNIVKRSDFAEWIQRLHDYLIARLKMFSIIQPKTEGLHSILSSAQTGYQAAIDNITSQLQSPLFKSMMANAQENAKKSVEIVKNFQEADENMRESMAELARIDIEKRRREAKRQAEEDELRKLQLEELRRKLETSPKLPFKIPAGTKWEHVSIKFLDEENVEIDVKKKKHKANYKEMGFIGKGELPDVQWSFLKVLAALNGEITIKDDEAKKTYKKTKEILTEKLQEYFKIDYDPFFPYEPYPPYKSQKSYKIKILLIPSTEINSLLNHKQNSEENEDFQNFFNEENPLVVD